MVKLTIGSVKSELQMMNTNLTGLKSKTQTLKNRFTQFSSNQELTGTAYNSHKDYIENMQNPTADGINQLCDIMITSNNEYSSALDEYFGDVHEIDEAKWRTEYEGLVANYNSLNGYFNWFMEFLGRISGAAAGIKEHYDIHGMLRTANSLGEQLELIREDIEWYREHIEKIGELLSATSGIYIHANMLSEAIGPAISLLGKISVGADGGYNVCAVNRKAFQDIQNAKIMIEVSQKLQSELGDDYLSGEEFAALESDEQIKYISRLAEVVQKYFPSLSSDLAEGMIEIPLAPGLYLYAGESIAVDVETDSPATLKIAVGKNKEILGNWEVNINGLVAEQTQEEYSFGYEYKIDDRSSAYVKVGYGVKDEGVKGEWGVETKVDNGGMVTTKCGIKVKNSDEQWQTVPVADFQLNGVDNIKFDSELWEYLGPVFGPAPGPVPVFG